MEAIRFQIQFSTFLYFLLFLLIFYNVRIVIALLSFCSALHHSFHAKFYTKNTKLGATSLNNPETSSNMQKEDIVIIGAGIAGLATSLSLHRLGVRSLVLEQSESLRTGGTSLTLFKNGWHVLDQIGVGHELRSKFLRLKGMVMKSVDGRELRSFMFDAPGQEVRTVERGALLETLASHLPSDSVLYMSKLKSIEKQGDDGTMLELENGSKILAKIVIGGDGVRSRIAKWMGLSEPKYVGYSAFRGLASYPEGQMFKPKIHYITGRGLRAGYIPASSTKVYWVIYYNTPVPGSRINESGKVKQEILNLLKGWPTEFQNMIAKTPDNMIVNTAIVDRWIWPWTNPPAARENVVLVGDAWHPMTPNLGQGACCALEDAVVLARKLACALGGSSELVGRALNEYSRERWRRVFPLTARANFVGYGLMRIDNGFLCWIRDSLVIPKMIRFGPLLEHTNFESDLKKAPDSI